VTPKLDTPKPWPVLFYIHAGEFYMGAANDLESNQPYAPSALQNVVLVTANDRLGNAGWMAAPQLRHRNKDNSTGNYGLQDQRAALTWVQKNIAFFGGDPTNVILMGESSGVCKTKLHAPEKKCSSLFFLLLFVVIVAILFLFY
jgi:carboxylesterase type B